MNEITLGIIWTLVVLCFVAIGLLCGKRYGIEYVIATMASLVVVSNIIAAKIIQIGPFTVPAGVLVFAATFLLTDVLAEKWGREQARRAVWAGFYANLIMVVAIVIATRWQAAPFATDFASSFDEVLGIAPRIVLASLTAYLVSQHHDIFAFEWWRRRTHGRLLVVRNIASTAVSQAADTLIFITIAFAGADGYNLVSLMVGQYVVKLAIATLDTPFVYLTCYGIDRLASTSETKPTS